MACISVNTKYVHAHIYRIKIYVFSKFCEDTERSKVTVIT